MNVPSPSDSSQSNGLCGVCGSPGFLQLEHFEKGLKSADWYITQLEWALESSIPVEWICHGCDHLLKAADQLKSELSTVLTTLRQRHNSLQKPRPGSGSAGAPPSQRYSSLQKLRPGSGSTGSTGAPPSQRQSSVCPHQANSTPIRPRDILISIWTDQLSPRSSCPTQDSSVSAAKGDDRVDEDPSKPTSEAIEKENEKKREDEAPRYRSGRQKRKMTVRLSCDVCSRTFGTVSMLARHRRRAHRGAAGVDSRGAENSRRGAGGAEDSRHGTGGAEDSRHDAGGADDSRHGTGGAEDSRHGTGGAEDSRHDAGGAEDSRHGAGGAEDSRHGAGGAEDSRHGAGGAEDSRHGEGSAGYWLQDSAADGEGQTKPIRGPEKYGEAGNAAAQKERLTTQAHRQGVRSGVCDSSDAGNDGIQSKDAELRESHSLVAAAGPSESREAAATTTESSSILFYPVEPSGATSGPVCTETVFTDPTESFPVNKEPSWFQSDAAEDDSCMKHACVRTLSGLVPATSHSPDPAILTGSTDMANELRLHPTRSGTPSESLRNSYTILEHTNFPDLTAVPSTSDTEVVETSTASYTNEEFNIAPDRNHELFISFDADVEQAQHLTIATNVQENSCPTSDTIVKKKDSIAPAAGNSSSLSSKSRPPHLRRKVVKETDPETEKRKKAMSSASKEKKTASDARRPRLFLYERHGQKWRCRQCSALFSSRTGAHGHALTHSEPDGGRCPRCGKTYANAYALRRHRAGCLSGRPPSCPVCNKIVADAAYLAQHVRSHSADAPKKHQCDQCGLAFASGARLRAHIAVEHSGETPYRCDICRREFKLQVQLRRHCRSVHAAVPVVTCEVCGKGFNRADHLRAHMTVHTGTRPFVCGECGRGFTRADTLADHKRLHTGEKPFRCAECGEAFREHRGYKRHLNGKHGQKPGGGGSGTVAAG